MWEGILLTFSPTGILTQLLGGIIGLCIGILPGLGPVFGLSLLLPFTFGMPPHLGLIFLASFYSCCVYGGSITAVLLGIPGTPGSITTVFDGYELSKKGRAGVGLGLSVTSSAIGGLIGVFSLAVFAPLLAEFAVKFSPADFFALAVFGLSIVAVAAKGDTLKGLMLGASGVLISTTGVDLMTGTERGTFGVDYLAGGIPFIPAVVGLFALSQAFVLAEQGGKIARPGQISGRVSEGIRLALSNWAVVLKNSILGTLIGVIPGVGINIANFIAYLFEKRTSKEPDSFGQGNPRGVIAPESANNACVASELIPAFALGIPGGATAAIFLAAITMFGLQPGYAFFSETRPVAWALIIALFSAQLIFFVIGVFGASYFARVTLVPVEILVPFIMVLSFIGGFIDRGLLADVGVVLIFGLVGYILHHFNYPVACIILGMILGPLAERNFYRAILISQGDFMAFFESPISFVLWLVTVAALAWSIPPVNAWCRRLLFRA